MVEEKKLNYDFNDLRIVSKITPKINEFRESISFELLKVQDKNLYLEWFNNEKVRKNLHPLTPKTQEEISDWITSMLKNKKMEYYILKFNKIPIGHIGIKNIDYDNKKAEISLVIGDTEKINTKIGMVAVISFIDKLFSEDRFDEIYLSRYVNRGKRIAGNSFFSSLGFVKTSNEDEDVYTLQKSKFYELKNMINFSPKG